MADLTSFRIAPLERDPAPYVALCLFGLLIFLKWFDPSSLHSTRLAIMFLLAGFILSRVPFLGDTGAALAVSGQILVLATTDIFMYSGLPAHVLYLVTVGLIAMFYTQRAVCVSAFVMALFSGVKDFVFPVFLLPTLA